MVKRHGATAVRCGTVHSCHHAGRWAFVSLFPDLGTYGRAAHALYQDQTYLGLLEQAARAGAEIVDRSISVLEDL